MKVVVRLASGSALAVALFVGALATQGWILRQIVSSTRSLAAVKFRASTTSFELLGEIDQIEQNARKFYVTRDPAYIARLTERRDVFAAGINRLVEMKLSGDEGREVAALVRVWHDFPLAAQPRDAVAGFLVGLDEGRLMEQVAAPLNRLHRQNWRVVESVRSGIESEVAANARASGEAERSALLIAIVATLVSAAILILTLRTIRRQLDALTRGTHMVAAGQFEHQLDVTGSDEFSSLAADFNSMVQRLGALDGMKRDFVSHVSHELRTPLVAMQETTRLLLEMAPGPLNDKQRRLLELNLNGSTRLARMITNLLDLSRVEAGAMTYAMSPRDLGAIVEEVVLELAPLQREREVAVKILKAATAVSARCDGEKLAQVIRNLIDNALKFSPPGETVEVSLDVAETLPLAALRLDQDSLPIAKDGWAMILVSDRGPGVQRQFRSTVFEKFRQIPGTPRRGGVGLGLAISREIVVAHRGTIWVQDRPGGGSVFVVALPRLLGLGAKRDNPEEQKGRLERDEEG